MAQAMVKKILNFTKIEHTLFSLPLIFTGAWLGAGHRWPAWRIMSLILLAATGARIFGMSFNRIFDRHIDALNPRTKRRELPSGVMSVRLALGIALGALVIYLIACALLGGWCWTLWPIPLIPLLVYSLLKRFTIFCHFGIGLCLALAPLGAFVAAAGHIHLTDQVLIFALYVFLWLSGADIIYAILDMENDRRNRIHSIPARFGATGAQVVSALCHLLSLTCLLLLLKTGRSGLAGFAVLGCTAVLFVLMYLPSISIQNRFFPISTLAGMAGAITPLMM